MASSKPSFPAPSEPNLKRLGVGGGGGDRPIRAQLVVAAVVLLVVIALPLYVLRRPSVGQANDADAGAAAAAQRTLIRTTLDAGKPTGEVRLGPLQRVQCSAASNRQGNEGNLCDRLPEIEQAFGHAIRSTVECAPKTGKEGAINFVLTVNFSQKRLNVFPGKSGEWKGPQAKAAAKCVQNAMPEIQWDTIPHRYRYYMFAIHAHYPAPDPLEVLPEFE